MMKKVTMSEREQTEKSLRDSQAELSAIYDHAPIVMILVDKERRVKKVNRAATKFANRVSEEMIGRRDGEALGCLHSQDDPRGCGFSPYCQTCTVRNTVRDTFQTGKSHRHVEARLPFASRQGKMMTFLLSTTLITLAEGKRVLVCLEDITELIEAKEALKQSEKKYRQFIETAHEGIWTLDAEGKTTFVNPHLSETLGYTVGEMFRKPLFAFMDEQGIRIATRNLERLRQGIREPQEFEFIRKDGTRVYTNLNASPIIEDGRNCGVLAFVTDITQRKQAEEALRQSEKKYRELVDSLPQTVFEFELDALGNFTFLNQNSLKIFSHLLQYPDQNWSVLRMFLPDYQGKIKESIQLVLSGKELTGVESTAQREDGSTFPVLLYASPIFQDNKAIGLRGIALDITDHKQMAQKLFEYEELNKLKTNLLSTVSHELRTPLATIKGYSTMLVDYDRRLEPEEKLEYLRSIDKATDRLTELIDHLLDMSRLEAGLLKLAKKPTRLSRLIQEAVAEGKFRALKHSIIAHLPRRLPKINIDGKRIRQVLDNLIDNATKYSEAGTEVVVSAKQTGQEVLVSVADQGIGISAEEQKKIFERFYRIEQRLNPEIGGAGLGLAICKGLVEAHRGRIWVESEVEKGSTFFFTLPLLPAEGENND